MSSWESDWRSEHFCTLKSLHSNNSTVITRPDNGSGAVILDYQCYVNKMMPILGGTTKFLRLGPIDSFNHTTSIETKFQRRLVEHVKRGLLSSAISDQIRPTGSIWPCLYGLPKTPKDDVPLRPILPMVSSPQQKVAKWLDRLLQHYTGWPPPKKKTEPINFFITSTKIKQNNSNFVHSNSWTCWWIQWSQFFMHRIYFISWKKKKEKRKG